MTINQTIGLVAHLKLNGVLKGEHGTEFHLVAVDLTEAHTLAETLRDLVNADLSHAFSVHEPPTLAEFFATLPNDGPGLDAEAHAAIVDTIRAHRDGPQPSTLSGWRIAAADWSPLKSEAFAEYRFANGITKDATDDERLAAYIAFDEVYAFRGDVSTPATRVAPVLHEPLPARDIDEGDTIPQSQVDTVGEAFKALPDERRSWVALNGAKVRLNPQSVDGVASVRRFEIMRGLIAMARAGFDDDDTLRAVCDLAIGEDTQMTLKLPAIVGSLTLGEAQRFASICSDFIEAGDISMSFRADGRCVISRAAA